MKKIIILSMTLLTAPIFAGPNCIDKQENSLECPCNCDMISKRWCIDCNHLQDAHPLTVVQPKKEMGLKRSRVYTPKDPQTILEKLAIQYVENKY